MINPEAKARQNIDQLLTAAGWIIQNRDAINLAAGQGIAVREFQLLTGDADYLLFVNRQAVGAIEAKKEGATLSGAELQVSKYSIGLPDKLPAPVKPLPFLYESTGVETFFRNGLDPDPRSRRLFAFHKPETLAKWLQAGKDTLRASLQKLPPLPSTNLWEAQFEAITNLEQSFANDRPRALIQMATGSGKTYTAVNSIYRLIKHGKAQRVLFLVDRNNLGRQVMNEFQQFTTPDDGRKFTELYTVQRLVTNTLDNGADVCITTIQRLFSMLNGEPEFNPENEEESMFDMPELLNAPEKVVTYNPSIPIEYFDFIVVDECHRSIYNIWRQVLEYFDAYLIGLTATPSKQTFGFFNQNLVMEYTRQRAVIDGVNVDEQVYTLRTRITQSGSTIDTGYIVDKRDRKTRQRRWEQLDDEVTYAPGQLDADVVAEDQIRTVLKAYRDRLPTEIFPGRTEVPKTLIFAKDDSHAEDIVRIAREVFGKGDEFCQKITYRVTGVKAEDLINQFRNRHYPRIAVTVDMIATGTDIKAIEVLLFMRMVKSRGLFEQMRGRGTRVMNTSDLQAVTPDASEKDHFVIVDAVGVFDVLKAETESLERKKSAPFAKLIDSLPVGMYDDDTFTSLAGRLTRLEKKLSTFDRDRIATASAGKTLHDLATALLDAVDPDVIEAQHTTAQQAMQDAADLFTPDLRTLLKEVQAKDEQIIDTISQDAVLTAGFSPASAERAQQTVESFRQFILDNQHEIDALQLLFNRPYAQRQLQLDDLRALAEALRTPPHGWTPETLWQAYAQVERDKVKQPEAKRLLTDLIALVRHAVQPENDLVPFREQVQARYQAWLRQQAEQGREFNADQRRWLDRIADHIAVNLGITPQDLDAGEFFNNGGRIAAMRVFGLELGQLLNELSNELVA